MFHLLLCILLSFFFSFSSWLLKWGLQFSVWRLPCAGGGPDFCKTSLSPDFAGWNWCLRLSCFWHAFLIFALPVHAMHRRWPRLKASLSPVSTAGPDVCNCRVVGMPAVPFWFLPCLFLQSCFPQCSSNIKCCMSLMGNQTCDLMSFAQNTNKLTNFYL